MNLVIVESPAKARTIEKFLGREFKVKASFGHVRDLPQKSFGIDVEHDFAPKYVIIPKAKKIITELKKEAEKAKQLYLATDFDREGEAIAWHVIQALGLDELKAKNLKLKTINRIVFHEITKKAIEEAIKNPRDIDINLVDAQQARRILDRIVGYKLSPFLWRKVMKGLSAGRVQSVAVRLIVEREREIQNFKPMEYWEIIAVLAKNKSAPGGQISNPPKADKYQKPVSSEVERSNIKNKDKEKVFKAKLVELDDKKIGKFDIKTEKEAAELKNKLVNAEYSVSKIERKEIKRSPAPPFITSTLQQEAFRKLGFSAKKTMLIAQQLYEGVELGEEGSVGLITYMRTDSTNMSKEAISQIREFISQKYGQNYLSVEPRQYRTKVKGAQEAHEAIRPTYFDKNPEIVEEFLDKEQFRLYNLIWKRTIATQMTEAVFDQVTVDVQAVKPSTRAIFQAGGQTIKFDGFIKVYTESKDEAEEKKEEGALPSLEEQEKLNLQELLTEQKFTQPPPRYTEASLVKALEENGIGRPSTYAPTISTIIRRGYVKKEKKYLKPQQIGFVVNDLLVAHFPEIVDVKFTADMEGNLDKIALGEEKWIEVIKEFYEPFIEHLSEKYSEVKKTDLTEKTEEKCPHCGKSLVIRISRFGRFYACSGYPECKYTKTILKAAKAPCPKCHGQVIERRSKKGKTFWGCINYPKCDFVSWKEPNYITDPKNPNPPE